MSKSDNEIVKASVVPAEVKVLFQPAVTADESSQDYWAMLELFATDFQPQDPFEWIYLNDAVAAQFEMRRLRQFKARSVDEARKDKLQRGAKAIENKLLANAILSMSMGPVLPAGTVLTDEDKQKLAADEAEANKASKQANAAAIDIAKADLDRLDKEFAKGEGAYDFAKWIDTYTVLDDLQRAAEQRFRIAVEQLDLHRQGRGARLRQVADEIVDAEFKEISVVPTSNPSAD